MVQEWFANRIFTYIVLGIFTAGVLVKLFISIRYHVLIRASKRMGTSKNKLMRVLRLKFETCYKIKLGVNNVDTFVDKYVYRDRICGLRLYTWEMLSGEFDILCGLSAAIFALVGSFYKCGQDEILFTLSVGIAGSAILLAVDYFMNMKMKHAILRTNIKDYLENFLKARLESGEFSAELVEQYKKGYMGAAPQAQKANKEPRVQPVVAKRAETTRGKEKRKEQDEALKRREEKKRELKELIAADKQNGKQKAAESQEVQEKGRAFDRERRAKDEIAASSNVQKISPYSRNSVKPVEKKQESKPEINPEEAKVIEDILKEYLS